MAVKRFDVGLLLLLPSLVDFGESLDEKLLLLLPDDDGALALVPNPGRSLYPRPAPPTAIALPLPHLKRDFRNHELCIASSNSASGTCELRRYVLVAS